MESGCRFRRRYLAKKSELEDQAKWRWDKSVCRFCGVGCGIMVATSGGRIVSVKGDPESPVNRGLNCIKGYYNAKIMYGTIDSPSPSLRKKNGKYDKQGKLRTRELGRGLRRDGLEVQGVLRTVWPEQRRHLRIGSVHGR